MRPNTTLHTISAHCTKCYYFCTYSWCVVDCFAVSHNVGQWRLATTEVGGLGWFTWPTLHQLTQDHENRRLEGDNPWAIGRPADQAVDFHHCGARTGGRRHVCTCRIRGLRATCKTLLLMKHYLQQWKPQISYLCTGIIHNDTSHKFSVAAQAVVSLLPFDARKAGRCWRNHLQPL